MIVRKLAPRINEPDGIPAQAPAPAVKPGRHPCFGIVRMAWNKPVVVHAVLVERDNLPATEVHRCFILEYDTIPDQKWADKSYRIYIAVVWHVLAVLYSPIVSNQI